MKKHDVVTYCLLFPGPELIKIGRTVCLEERVRNLRVEARARCLILGLRFADVEKEALEKFAQYGGVCSKHEWFRGSSSCIVECLTYFNQRYPEPPVFIPKEFISNYTFMDLVWFSEYMRSFLRDYLEADELGKKEVLLAHPYFRADQSVAEYRSPKETLRGRVLLSLAEDVQNALKLNYEALRTLERSSDGKTNHPRYRLALDFLETANAKLAALLDTIESFND